MYEGGIRVPAIVHLPGAIAAGSVSDTPIVTSDFYPTITELAGLDIAYQPLLDGVGLMPVLAGQEPARAR